MTFYKGLMTGTLVLTGILLMTALTYLIPMVLVRSTDTAETEPSNDITKIVQDPDSETAAGNDEPDGPVIVIRPFHRVVTSEGKRELEIKAEKASIDQTSRLFNLSVVEEVVFWGKEGEKATISADRGSWNQQTNIVNMRDNVKAVLETHDQTPLHFLGDWLEYDSHREILTGGDRIQINHDAFKAIGDRIRIRPSVNHLELEHNVIATIQPEVFSGSPFLDDAVVIECGLLHFNTANQVIQFDLKPVVKNRNNTMTAKRITVFTDSDNVRVIWKHDVRFVIYIPDSPDPIVFRADEIILDRNAGSLMLDRNTSIHHSSASVMADDRIIILFDPDTEQIMGGQASGNVVFNDREFSGASDMFSWNAAGNIILLIGNATLTNNTDTRVFADQIQLQPENNVYSAVNNVRLEIAQSNSEDSQNISIFNLFEQQTESPLIIHSRLLEVDERSGDMVFDDNVYGHQGSFQFSMNRMDIRFDSQTRQMVDLTGRGDVTLQDMDRLVLGQTLVYSAVTGDVNVRENPVLWYGNTQVRADKFDYNEHERLLKMSGNVEAVAIMTQRSDLPFDERLPGKTSASEDDIASEDTNQTIYLTAGNGAYNELTGDFHFQDNVVMKQGLWTIRSDTLSLLFDTESGNLSGADALGSVRIDHSLFYATGHSLTWSPETSILVLRGTDTQKSQVVQGERGSAGDEIRFFTDENRFVVEKGLSVIMPSEIMETIR